MAKKKQKAKRTATNERDSAYFLKIVLYLIVGSQWIHFSHTGSDATFPFPIGLVIGVIFATHDHFQIDRKIEYALLLIAAFIGFWSQAGVYINL